MTEHGAMGQSILALETLLEHHKDNLKIICEKETSNSSRVNQPSFKTFYAER